MQLPLWKMKVKNLTFTVTTIHSIVDYHLLKFHPYFLGYLFWSCHQKMPICYQWWQGCYMFKTCQCEECLSKFAEDDCMDKKIREAWMWKSMCWIKWVAQHWKLKTLVKTRFVSKMSMFEKALDFKKAIVLCYGLSSTMFLQQKIP
jgi:hypothetical protein